MEIEVRRTAGLKLAIDRGWLWKHESGTYVKFTQAGGGYVRMIDCFRCDDCGWVCENHPERLWQGEHACDYGGAGAPARVAIVRTATRCRVCRSRLTTRASAGTRSFSPSIVPEGANQDVYLVLNQFGERLGRAWCETDERSFATC